MYERRKGAPAPPSFENRTLYHGDTIEFLRGMDSGTIHLTATEPPFLTGLRAENERRGRMARRT